jgi:hypothetical protein
VNRCPYWTRANYRQICCCHGKLTKLTSSLLVSLGAPNDLNFDYAL